MTTTEKPSLRTNEVSVAISLSLFTIRNVVIASLQNAGVAISLLTIRKSKLQNVKIKTQNEDNLVQIDSE